MPWTPEKTAGFQQAQIGLETTPGTAVAATVRLMGLQILPKPTIETRKFTPRGKIVPTLAVVGKDYTTARIEGQPTYQEIGYVLKGCLSNEANPIIKGDSKTTAIQTYTVESGEGTAQDMRFAMGTITGFRIRWNSDEVSIEGDIIGQATDFASRTSGLTDVDVQPIQPDDITVYLDGSELTRVFDGEIEVTGRWQPVWVSGQMVNIVEVAPTVRVNLKTEANADGIAHFAWLRGGNATKVFKWQALGGATTPKVEIEVGVKVGEPQEFDDVDGVYAFGLDLQGVIDTTLTGAVKATISLA